VLERSHSKLEPCRLAPTRDVVRVATPGRAAARPDTTAGAPLRSPVPRLPHRRLHPIRPCHAPHAHESCKTVLRRPPNRDVAVRAPRRPSAAIGRRASPPPHRAHAVDGCDPLLKARVPTKGLDSPPRALPRASSRHCRRQRR
jgi:hypothetical protein